MSTEDANVVQSEVGVWPDEEPTATVAEPPECSAGTRPIVEPTLGMLSRATKLRPLRGETAEKLLRRVTHLHLEQKGLMALGDVILEACPAARVLYLADNQLFRLGHLGRDIQQLHLGGNMLREMGTWSRELPYLEVLDLRGNYLRSVEGLDASRALRELALSGQRGGDGQPLRFCEQTLSVIQPSLKKLELGRCSLSSIDFLSGLQRVERLDLSDNKLQSMDAVAPVLRYLRSLRWLQLEGNPMCKGDLHFRDAAILAAAYLEELDGQPVSQQERVFLTELERRRRRRRRGPSEPAPQKRALATDAPQRLLELYAGGAAGAAGAAAARWRSASHQRLSPQAADVMYRPPLKNSSSGISGGLPALPGAASGCGGPAALFRRTRAHDGAY